MSNPRGYTKDTHTQGAHKHTRTHTHTHTEILDGLRGAGKPSKNLPCGQNEGIEFRVEMSPYYVLRGGNAQGGGHGVTREGWFQHHKAAMNAAICRWVETGLEWVRGALLIAALNGIIKGQSICHTHPSDCPRIRPGQWIAPSE